MPSARIRLEIDKVTRKRTIVISYESDADALPHEHEEQHRALVAKLFEGNIAKDGDDIRVEREGAGAAAPTAPGEQAQEEARSGARQGIKQGS
jgi:hypothetical protein